MLKKFIFITAVLCVHAAPGFSASQGTSGAQFLQIVTSPRVAAMGSAYTALCDDVNSIAFNPAGLGFLQYREMELVQNNWIQSISNQYAAVAIPSKSFGTLGLEVDMLSVTGLVRTDNFGNADGTKFGSSDISYGLAYAKSFGDRFSAGFKVKMINETIDNAQASGSALDLGVLYRVASNFDIGIAEQNIGSGIEFISESDPLPTTLKAGIAYRPLDNMVCALILINQTTAICTSVWALNMFLCTIGIWNSQCV